MSVQQGRSPLTGKQLVDEFFIENRTRLLEIAAFLDRLERSADQVGMEDFRMRAFCAALQVLVHGTGSRVLDIQMIFSDPTTAPLAALDQKSANGAWAADQAEEK